MELEDARPATKNPSAPVAAEPSAHQAAHNHEAVVRRFLGAESRFSIAPLGRGLINETLLVEQPGRRFVLQRINGTIFSDADAIAMNLLRLERWLSARPAAMIHLPALVLSSDGAAIVRDPRGEPWRMLEYVDNSRVLGALTNRQQASAVGHGLGRFHAAFAAFDPAELSMTLPDLHDTPRYQSKLDRALHSPKRPVCAAVSEALEQIEAHSALFPLLQQALSAGMISLRVTHGDPKLDNVLFHHERDEVICLIDLDTVQPGLFHHDLADCLRSCCNRAGKDRSGEGLDVGAVQFDFGIARALLSGYAQAAGHLFDDQAIELLAPAISLIPLELAMRFLTDHLNGDRYFRVSHPRQNLIKARRQLSLVADIETKFDLIGPMIADCFSAQRRHMGADS
jgi:Ser/Thr protein kinase RdoA (MazF antagonist)